MKTFLASFHYWSRWPPGNGRPGRQPEATCSPPASVSPPRFMDLDQDGSVHHDPSFSPFDLISMYLALTFSCPKSKDPIGVPSLSVLLLLAGTQQHVPLSPPQRTPTHYTATLTEWWHLYKRLWPSAQRGAIILRIQLNMVAICLNAQSMDLDDVPE